MKESTANPAATTDLDTQSAQEQLHELLGKIKTVILGTASGRGAPHASYAPYISDEKGNLYVYVSSLARHTQNLRGEQSVSALLIEDESQSQTLYARRRLTWNCKAELVERESDEFEQRMDAFAERFGGIIENLKGMTDFHLFRLSPEDGRLVLGFGAAYRVIGLEVQKQIGGRHQQGHTTK